MRSKIVRIKNIELLLRKNSLAKHISISVKPFKGVQVTLPVWASFRDGEKLALEKILWIEEHLSGMRKLENNYPPLNDPDSFRTRNHRLKLIPAAVDKVGIKLKNGLITIKYPSGMMLDSADVKKAVNKGIEKAYREEAVEFLPKRLNDISDKMNLPFNELYIKNIRSRWGSCSGKNNINLSIHLMRLPDHLIDYVLLHELAHTKVRNHSKKFWDFLDTLTGNAKGLDKELKKFRIP
ncbi:MAG: SprT family zinc-dependent metalloprotease [Melioribacteraceae bacterium]